MEKVNMSQFSLMEAEPFANGPSWCSLSHLLHDHLQAEGVLVDFVARYRWMARNEPLSVPGCIELLGNLGKALGFGGSLAENVS